MATRRTYVDVAAAFKAAREDVTGKEPNEDRAAMLDGISLAAEHVADVFKRHNKSFSRERFLTDCGVST
jgi:hypothetical protein